MKNKLLARNSLFPFIKLIQYYHDNSDKQEMLNKLFSSSFQFPRKKNWDYNLDLI